MLLLTVQLFIYERGHTSFLDASSYRHKAPAQIISEEFQHDGLPSVWYNGIFLDGDQNLRDDPTSLEKAHDDKFKRFFDESHKIFKQIVFFLALGGQVFFKDCLCIVLISFQVLGEVVSVGQNAVANESIECLKDDPVNLQNHRDIVHDFSSRCEFFLGIELEVLGRVKTDLVKVLFNKSAQLELLNVNWVSLRRSGLGYLLHHGHLGPTPGCAGAILDCSEDRVDFLQVFVSKL